MDIKSRINAMSYDELEKLLQSLSDVLSGLNIGEGEAFKLLSEVELIAIQRKQYDDKVTRDHDIATGTDYREVHPDGKLARGVRNGAYFNEVLDTDGNVAYSVHYNPQLNIACLRVSADVFVSVNLQGEKIINSRNKQAFYDDMLAQHEDYQGVDVDEAIIDYTQREIDCPRW